MTTQPTNTATVAPPPGVLRTPTLLHYKLQDQNVVAVNADTVKQNDEGGCKEDQNRKLSDPENTSTGAHQRLQTNTFMIT